MKAKAKTRVDWPSVWAEFTKWYDDGPTLMPSWESQQRKIAMLVEKQLRKAGKRVEG